MKKRNGITINPKKDSKGKLIKNKWLVTVSFQANNERIRKKETVIGTKQDAIKRGEALRQELKLGLAPEMQSLTFEQFASEWHQARVKSGELRSRSIDGEKYKLERLIEVLGAYQLKSVTPNVIKSAYACIKSTPKDHKQETLSGSTMHAIHGLLNQIMKDALRQDLILINPCEKVKAPKKDTKEKEYLSALEVSRLASVLDICEKQAYANLFSKTEKDCKDSLPNRKLIHGLSELSYLMALRLALATGARKEEVFGLIWQNVAKNCHTISIEQVLTSKGKIEQPKTRKSRRVLVLDENTSQHLKAWRKNQHAFLSPLGIKDCLAIPVCCSNIGGYASSSNFYKWLRKWKRIYNFDFTPHTLRHTQATLLLNNPNITLKQVQARLGHASAATTLDTYGHLVSKEDKKSANVIGEIMRSGAQ